MNPDFFDIDSALTEEERAVRDSVRRFVDERVLPIIGDCYVEGRFPRELIPEMAALGVLGANLPEQYGCAGLNNVAYGLIMQELERGDSGIRSFASVQGALVMYPIYAFGSDEHKNEWLPRMARGEAIGCFGLTESDFGSNPSGMITMAMEQPDGTWVLNGGKMWITNGTQADWICLLANTGDGPVHRNKSLICVPMKSKGVQIARKLDKLGMRSSDTAQIFFDNVRVPKRNRIGEEGAGFTYQMIQFQEERLWGAASCLKALEVIIDETIEYTRGRKAFGGTILDNQVVHFKLAEMQTEVELLRSLIYRAGEQLVAGEDVTRLASMAKLKAGRLGREVTDACLQYWGGMGFMNETHVSRAYRDFRLTSIGGGADEVMLMVLCKMMGILPGQRKGNA